MDLLDHAEDMAKELKGNWRKFECFMWFDKPDDAEEYCLVYTHNRDSDTATRVNAEVISEELEPFSGPDCIPQRHSHWGPGWVEGYAIRVYGRDGELTPAFLKYAELQLALEDYPILDDSRFSAAEHEECLEAIRLNAPVCMSEDETASKVFSWLWENKQSELEDNYPSQEAVSEAMLALKLITPEDLE